LASSTESFVFKGVSATPAAFLIKGGVYTLIVTGTTIGTVQLGILSADGATYAPVGSGVSAAGVTQPIWLPPGQCQISLTSSTSVNLTLARIPS
jgi:hypothetical protein